MYDKELCASRGTNGVEYFISFKKIRETSTRNTREMSVPKFIRGLAFEMEDD